MAYETAVSISSLDNLLDALADFAAANGFTKLSTITGTGRQSDMYVLQKGSMYWWLLGYSGSDAEYGSYGQIESRMMTTAPTLANRETTALGQRELTKTFLFDKPDGTYLNSFFYADSNAIHAVIEVSTNIFTHLSFGIIDKAGTWTGGEYLTGSDITIGTAYSASSGFNWTDGNYRLVFGGTNSSNASTGYLYYPYESQGDQRDWSAFHISSSSSTEGRRTRASATIAASASPVGPLFNSSPNAFNERAMLIPTYLFVYDNRAGGTLRNIVVGTIPNARIVNMTNISPQAIVNTDWDVFPQFQKAGDAFSAPESGANGVAYKRIV